jgi:hypothetical protein
MIAAKALFPTGLPPIGIAPPIPTTRAKLAITSRDQKLIPHQHFIACDGALTR